MDNARELDSRVASLEQQLAILTTRLDRLSGKQETAAGVPGAAERPDPRAERPQAKTPSIQPVGQRDAQPGAPRELVAALATPRSTEWWLSRAGVLLTSFALILLYQYAVDQNWITPAVRLATGTVVGGVLMILAMRLPSRGANTLDASVGLREVLMGGALSAWYITAYAGAVFYQLIPMGAARAIYFVLSVAGAWLALRERRALLALLALGVGFSTPTLLSSPAPSIPAFAAYLAALTAVGLVVYLVRGWQSVLWLTFLAFWWSIALTAAERWAAVPFRAGTTGADEVAMTILLLACTAAFVRVPILRRRLLALGSDRYTEPRRSAEAVLRDAVRVVEKVSGQPGSLDSLALWAITLSSPLLGLRFLSSVWPAAPSALWAMTALAAAGLAFRLASSPRAPREEFTHVEAAAAALWSLVGVVWLASAFAESAHVSVDAARLAAASLHAFAILRHLGDSVFVVTRRLALVTAALAAGAVVSTEAFDAQSVRAFSSWTVAEGIAVGVAAWIWWSRMRARPVGEAGGSRLAALFGILAYVATLQVDARVLASVWPPLVTASYAIAGTALLLLAGRPDAGRAPLRKVGAFTLAIVVARLLVVDLAGVETIWRVLLFLGCGALFLFTSYRLQSPRGAESA